jgi:hypothetical protein
MSGKPANTDPFRLHPMAEQSLVMVGERLGVTLDAVSCWRWLRELEDLALKMEGAPDAPELCADIDAPFCIGNVRLWLPSPAQLELCVRAERLADCEKLAVMAFILSRGREASALRKLFTVSPVRLAEMANEWMRGVEVSYESLKIAVEWVMTSWFSRSDATDAETFRFNKRDWGAVVSALMAEYAGFPPEHWMFGLSCAQLKDRKSSMTLRNAIRDAKMAIALGKSAPGFAVENYHLIRRAYYRMEADFEAWARKRFAAAEDTP